MYIPRPFQQQDQTALVEVMSANPFATVVTSQGAGFVVNHLPLVVGTDRDDKLLLKGHVARANSVWKISRVRAIAIFHGPHAYVSPSAYPGKKEHGKVVPTWNYVAVHASGLIDFTHDPRWKMAFLNQLTDINEASQANPWSVSDAPEEFIDKLLGAIVGFEIPVETLEGKWKLSQNQPVENYMGVVTALSGSGDCQAQEVARIMANRASTPTR